VQAGKGREGRFHWDISLSLYFRKNSREYPADEGPRSSGGGKGQHLRRGRLPLVKKERGDGGFGVQKRTGRLGALRKLPAGEKKGDPKDLC